MSLLLLLQSYVLIGATAAAPKVKTEYGIVEGLDEFGCDVFHGVPFAAPPTGPLRWKQPVAPTPWTDVKSTVLAGAMCPQIDLTKGLVLGHEDCLYLSVYSPPQCTAATPCPVMFWIYGGAWILGNNEEFSVYNAINLAVAGGVVVVAANYRVDVLGWVALQELADEEKKHGAYGNYGLNDQTFALEWTQRNVKAFGGNPEIVTIFGESAGGFSVCQHLTMPASNGLFSRAIIQSGDCSGPWLIFDGENAKHFGDTYATLIGCPSTGSSAAAAADRLVCLRGKSSSEVMEPYTKWLCPAWLPRPHDPWCGNHTAMVDSFRNVSETITTKSHFGAGPRSKVWPNGLPPMAPIIGWTAVIDGSPTGLPAAPLDLIRAGKVNVGPNGKKVSIIMGSNDDEMALFLIALPLIMGNAITFPPTSNDVKVVAEYLASYHAGWNSSTVDAILAQFPSSDYTHEAYRLVRIGTELIFRCGTRATLRALTDAGHVAYEYAFAYHFTGYIDPTSEACELSSELLCGVYHASELRFVFDTIQIPLDLPDRRVARTFGSYWTNFAKNGDPNGEGLVLWPQFNRSADAHLQLNDPPVALSGLARETCDFLDTISG